MTPLQQAAQQALSTLESGALLCELTAASMLRVALEAEQAQAVEPKLPELFSEIEWLGSEVRVHVFQRRADQTPLNVHSSTHPAPPPAGEPVCPDCHAPGLLYECAHCSASNYPAQQSGSEVAKVKPEYQDEVNKMTADAEARKIREQEELDDIINGMRPEANNNAFRNWPAKPITGPCGQCKSSANPCYCGNVNTGESHVGGERAAFESWYAKHCTESGFTMEPSEVQELREDDHYGDHRAVLNGKWEGWRSKAQQVAVPLRECYYESPTLRVCNKCGQRHDKAILHTQGAKQ